MICASGLILTMSMLGCLYGLYGDDFCSANPCLNGGQCSSSRGDNDYECSCIHGWTGTNCDKDIDDCEFNVCQNGGQCINQFGSKHTCNCTDKYVGNSCEFPNPCLINRCQNKGLCKSFSDGSMFCQCSKRFSGDLCEVRKFSCPKERRRGRKICSLRGECHNNENGERRCKCDLGYSGEYCSLRMKGNIGKECTDDACLNRGKCQIQGHRRLICICPIGYSGDRCEVQRNDSSGRQVEPQSVPIKEKPNPIETLTPCHRECKDVKSNGVCNQKCNSDQCQYDGGDCDPWIRCKRYQVAHCRHVFRNNQCNPECNNADCLFDGQDCDRLACANSTLCSIVYQNGKCDENCNSPQCGFDGGDCQWAHSDTFFTNNQKCSRNSMEEFEIDVILIMNMNSFLENKLSFLQALGSVLKMVLTIYDITNIKWNYTSALRVKLKISPSECIIYGGQCFGSLEQVSNFIQAWINRDGVMRLPFKVAKIETKTLSSRKIKPLKKDLYFAALIMIGSVFIVCLIVMGVLLRDRWSKLRRKVKTAGIWTPTDDGSSSTLSINSFHKSRWPPLLQSNNIKVEQRHLVKGIHKFDDLKNSRLEKEFDSVPDVTKRKRKFYIFDSNDISFEAISENLQQQNGIYPDSSHEATLLKLINENIQRKNDQRLIDQPQALADIGAYVNENGESLLHIASRLNYGANIIKRLHSIGPGMLHSTDEWGRTPLVTAVASDSSESVDPLLMLEKHSRKDLKQLNKSAFSQTCYPSCGTTALIESVKLNSRELITLLMDEGSPVNVLDSRGRSVVHWAAIFNNVFLLERLSRMKIFQKLVQLRDNEERTPLYLAANEGSFDSAKFIVNYLIILGIKVNDVYPYAHIVPKDKGFMEIDSMFKETQRPEKIKRKKKPADPRIQKKQTGVKKSNKEFGIINECTEDSIKLDNHSLIEPDSIDSFLFDDCPINTLLDSYSYDRSKYSSFKPYEMNCNSYLSNNSSSDMSPPLLNFNYPSIMNGCHSNQSDQTLSNRLFLSPTMVVNTKPCCEKPSVMNQLEPPVTFDRHCQTNRP